MKSGAAKLLWAGGPRSAPFCVLLSIKRQVRAAWLKPPLVYSKRLSCWSVGCYSYVNYGVRFPKFIYPVCSCSYWLTPRNSTLPPYLDPICKRALLVFQDRRHLFVTPWCYCTVSMGWTASVSLLAGGFWRENTVCENAVSEFCQMYIRSKCSMSTYVE